MRRSTTRVMWLAVMAGSIGVIALWAAGVFAAAIGVWQYAGLALLLAAGLALTTFAVHRVRRAMRT